jgi:hypothetical protein
MTSAVASVCLRDVGVCVLVDFIVRVAVLVILHRLQLLPCHLFLSYDMTRFFFRVFERL